MSASNLQEVATRAPQESGSGRLESLYEAHVAHATGSAYLMTGDEELARDLAHEAFIRVASRFHHIRNPGVFDAYLRRTVVNLVKNHFRRLAVERAFVRAGPDRTLSSGEVVDWETKEQLWQSLQRLPPRQRITLVLRYYEGLSENETADVLGSSVSAVKGLSRRGLASLREWIGEES